MRKIFAFILAFSVCLTAIMELVTADDVITVAHGDQIVVTLRNDELVDIDHTVLLTSDSTVEGVFTLVMSLDGRVVEGPRIAHSDIENVALSSVIQYPHLNISKFNVTIRTTVEPFKFKGVTISCTVAGRLTFSNNIWDFRSVFSSTAGALAPPEIVVKVPKPSEFSDLSFIQILPTPGVFLEEGTCYTLVWKSEAFMVGNTSATLVRLKYSTTTNWFRAISRFGPPVVTFVLGLAIRPIWNWVRGKIMKDSNSSSSNVGV